MRSVPNLAKAAVFVDAENQTDFSVVALLQALAHLNIVERHAYADWRNFHLTANSQELDAHAFQLHHVYSGERLGMQKNKTDLVMAGAVRNLVRRHPEIEVVVLVTGDHFFADLVWELQRWGKQVYIAASPMSISKELRKVAPRYIPLGQMAAWIQTLDTLEQQNPYLTFCFTIRKSKILPADLLRLIRCGVVQKECHRTDTGIREQLFLNRRSHAVRMVLGA